MHARMEEINNNENGVCKCSCGNTNLFPPGFEFDPSDKELLEDYLKKKIMNEPLPFNEIMQYKFLELNLYSLDNPDMLEENYKLCPEDKKWFIFTSRDKMNPNGTRPKRSAGVGFWKAIIGDKPVRHNDGTIVGKKKILTFYKRGPLKVEKTNWLMHEYTIPHIKRPIRTREDKRLDDWVLCKVYKKKTTTEDEKLPLPEEEVEAEAIKEEVQTPEVIHEPSKEESKPIEDVAIGTLEDEKPPEEEVEVEAIEEVKTPEAILEPSKEESKPIEDVTIGTTLEEQDGVLLIDVGELEESIEYCYGSIYKASLIQDQGTQQQQRPTNTNNNGLEMQQQQHFGTMNQTLPLPTAPFFNQFYEDPNWIPQAGIVTHKLGL